MTVSYTVSDETMALIVRIINQNARTALSRDCTDLRDLRDDLISAGYISQGNLYDCMLEEPDAPSAPEIPGSPLWPIVPVNPILRCPNDPATCEGCVDCSCHN